MKAPRHLLALPLLGLLGHASSIYFPYRSPAVGAIRDFLRDH